MLPALARARDERRLAGNIAGFATALVVVAVPLLLVARVRRGSARRTPHGNGSDAAQDACADALRWIVPAAVAHLFAGLAASGLAALDDYVTAAFGYAAGSAAGLVLILQRVDADGIVAVAWGIALNGAIALLVPVAAGWLARSAIEHACDGRSSGRAAAFVSARRICGRRRAPDRAPAALRRVSAVRRSSGAGSGHELRLRVPRGGELSSP